MAKDITHKIKIQVDKTELDEFEKQFERILEKNKLINFSWWIPADERLPDNEKPCLVAYRNPDFFGEKDETIYYMTLSFMPEHRIWNIKSPIEVVAWQPIDDFIPKTK